MVLKQQLLARLNGADICMLERFHILRSWEVDVQMICLLPLTWKEGSLSFLKAEGMDVVADGLNRYRYEVDGSVIEVRFDTSVDPDSLQSLAGTRTLVSQLCEETKPELVWASYTDFLLAAALLHRDADHVWLDISDNEYPRLNKLADFSPLDTLYAKLRHVMVASPFMAREVKKDFPKAKIHYWPNPIFSCDTPVETTDMKSSPPGYWLFVNPVEVKGLSFAVELAKALPRESFVFLGNWNSEPPQGLPANIQFRTREKSLRPLWPCVKGLLVPSQWQEAFGRIPLEAMAAGVPVLSSDQGALPETVADGGLVRPLILTQWLDAMSCWSEHRSELVKRGALRWSAYRQEVDSCYAALKQRFLSYDA